MRITINYFIVNMAMSDILLPTAVFPLFVTIMHVDLYSAVSVSVTQVICKFLLPLQDFPIAVSIQSIVLIAVDRFGAVVFPFRSPLISSKLCLFLILWTWIVAISIHLPMFIAFEVVEYLPGKLSCAFNRENAGESFSFKYYAVAITVAFINIPLALMTILYSITDLFQAKLTKDSMQPIS